MADELKEKLQREYTRTYNNFDRLMRCLEEILIYCRAKKDSVLSEIISDCLNDLQIREVNNGTFK